MVKLSTGTWVVVADGQKALFLENVTDAEDPNLVLRRDVVRDNPPTREQGAAPPGRRSDTGPGQRSALEETDWHTLEKLRFADDLAALLEAQHRRGAYRRLVLVASAPVLGELRHKLAPAVAEAVVAEIDKVLTGHPIDRIEKIVSEALGAAG
ncbi:MAG: host attachment family protein [Paracoccaceae bacterium]|nr:host attachment family protein [Paracoccaceae bacterium]